MRKPQARPGIQSVEVAAVILDTLANGAGPTMPLKDLAVASGMLPGKVHRYLVSLTRTGLVEQDPSTGQYSIGPLSLKIGLVALGNIDVVRYASAEMPKLRDEIDETVVLAVWGNLGPTVVRIEEGGQAVTMNLRIGTVLPVMGTAIGRVFAAFLPASSVKDIMRLQRGRVDGAENISVLKSRESSRDLAETKSRGLSRIAGTLVPGVSALAAPIFDHQGSVAAVLASIGREADFEISWGGPIACSLKDVAAQISRRLGDSS